MKQKAYNWFLAVFLMLITFPPEAKAQRNIINVPTSDILPKGEIILRQSNRFRPFEPDPFVTLTPSAAIGVGKDIEVLVGVATKIEDETEVKADLSIKKVFFITGATRFVVGTRWNPVLTSYDAPDSFTYAEIAQRIVKTKTLLVSGVTVVGRNEALPDSVSAMVGVEQVLTKKLRLAVDWISGKESYAMLGAGLKYRITPTLTLTGSVSIPNKNKDELSFSLNLAQLLPR